MSSKAQSYVQDDLSKLGNMQITVLPWMTLNTKGQLAFDTFQILFAEGKTSDTMKHWIIAQEPSGLNTDGLIMKDNICLVGKVRTAPVVFMDRNDPPQWAFTCNNRFYRLG